MQQDTVVRIRMDNGGLQASADQAARSFEKVGAAGQASARQTAAAFRQLPAQFTDIATQLAGGGNPLLVLLQQGGQIKDSFGGIGAAARGLALAFNPLTAGATLLAAAFGGVAFAAIAGAREQAAFRNALALTGNAAGLTEDRFEAMAAGIAEATEQTSGQARELIMALARTGSTSGAILEGQARVIARIADLSGQSVKEIAGSFAGQLAAPARAAAELNKAYNFLSVEQFKRIQQLEREGKAVEAVTLTNTTLETQLRTQRSELGLLETAWNGLAEAISSAKAAALSIGKAPGFGGRIQGNLEQLRGLEAQLANNRRLGRGDAVIPGLGSLNAGLEQQIAALRDSNRRLVEERDRAEIGALARSEQAAKTRAEIAGLLGASSGKSRERDRGGPVNLDILDANDARAAMINAWLREDPLGAFIDDQLNAQQGRDDKRLQQQTDFLQSLVDGNARTSAQLITEEQARGEALLELDRQIMMRRLDQLEISGDARAEAERLIGERAELARTELLRGLADGGRQGARETGRELYDDVRQSLSDAFRDSKDPMRAFVEGLANTLYTRVTARLADALATAAVGKDGTGGLLAQLAGLFTYGGSSTNPSAGNYENSFDLMNSAPRMATGTNYVPRDMLAFLHRGEAVVPRQHNPDAGGSGRVIVNQAPMSIRIDSRSDQEQVAANVRAAVAEGNRQLLEDMRDKGLIP